MAGYYRIHSPLSYGRQVLHANTIHWLRLQPENISKLVELGLISPIQTPPISEVPELSDYAERLADLGIHNVQQFLEAQYDDLSSIWRRKDHIDNHKQNLIDTYLMVEVENKNGCNC